MFSANFNVNFEKILIKFTGSEWGEGGGGALASEHFKLVRVFNKNSVKPRVRIAGGYLVVGGSVSDGFRCVWDLNLANWEIYGLCCRRSVAGRVSATGNRKFYVSC